MRLLSLAVCLSFASKLTGSPVPAVKWVTEFEYTTVTVGYDAYTAYLASASQNNEAAGPTAVTELSITEPENTEISEPQVTNEAPKSSGPPQTSTAPQVTEKPSTLSIASTVKSQTPTSTESASSTSDSSEPSGATFSGEGTYYDPEMGACGKVNSADEMIVAISHELYDKNTPNGNPNKNTLCGKKIKASYEGKSVEVSVVDRCVGCARDDLDLSPAAFEKIADKDLGRINLTWQWAN